MQQSGSVASFIWIQPRCTPQPTHPDAQATHPDAHNTFSLVEPHAPSLMPHAMNCNQFDQTFLTFSAAVELALVCTQTFKSMHTYVEIAA